MSFNINRDIPQATDLISQHPAGARAFRGTVDDWMKFDHNDDPGGHTWVTLSSHGSAPTNPPSANLRLYSVGNRLYTVNASGEYRQIFNSDTLASFNTAVTGIDAATLNGDNAAFYRNAGNINAGTLADARLPSTQSGKTFTSPVSFSGSLEIGGGVFARSGTVIWRPNGLGSTSNQATYSTTGNFVAAGNVTASSDERLKTDWAALADDIIERIAEIKSGTFTRLDNDLRQVGVGAQSLREILPEAVLENEDEETGEITLSVAYGHAALALVVELAKRIVKLERRNVSA